MACGEADLILWLRYKLERPLDATYSLLSLTPVTIGSLQEYDWHKNTLPIFQGAASHRFFDRFKVVLGVDSKDEFMQLWERAFPKVQSSGMTTTGNRFLTLKDLHRLSAVMCGH